MGTNTDIDFLKVSKMSSMILTKAIVIILTTTVLSYNVQAQEEETTHSHKNEISVAAGIVPIISENKLTAGFHLHYVRGMGNTKKFGLGVSLETIIDEHKHYTLSIVFQYRFFEKLSILGEFVEFTRQNNI